MAFAPCWRKSFRLVSIFQQVFSTCDTSRSGELAKITFFRHNEMQVK